MREKRKLKETAAKQNSSAGAFKIKHTEENSKGLELIGVRHRIKRKRGSQNDVR